MFIQIKILSGRKLALFEGIYFFHNNVKNMLVTEKSFQKEQGSYKIQNLDLSPAYKQQLQEYDSEAKNLFNKISHSELPQKIKFKPKYVGTKSIRILKIQRGGAIVIFVVTLGWFEVNIIMLNVNNLPSEQQNVILGAGSFGSVLDTYFGTTPIVIKRIYFQQKEFILKQARDGYGWNIKGSSRQIHDVLYEYAFNKISQLLKIGPRVGIDCNIDIMCFQNSIQFQMERCYPVKITTEYTVEKLQNRLKYCMRVLHSFYFIHKDIKPTNILYSEYLKNWVFVDFGLSDYILEQPGEGSFTFREGTLRYMHPELANLKKGQYIPIDLYQNDLHGLLLTISAFKQQIQRKETFQIVQQQVQPSKMSKENEVKMIVQILYYDKKFQNSSKKEENNLYITKSIGQTFPQVLSKVAGQPTWNPQFLIRSIGFNLNVYNYLRLCPMDSKLSLAINKLLCNPYPFSRNSCLIRKGSSLVEQNLILRSKMKEIIVKLNQLKQQARRRYVEYRGAIQKFTEEILIEAEQFYSTRSRNMIADVLLNQHIKFNEIKNRILCYIDDEKVDIILLCGSLTYLKKRYDLSLSIFQLLEEKAVSLPEKVLQYDITNYLYMYFLSKKQEFQKRCFKKLFVFLVCELADIGMSYYIGKLFTVYYFGENSDEQTKNILYHGHIRSRNWILNLSTFLKSIQSKCMWIEKNYCYQQISQTQEIYKTVNQTLIANNPKEQHKKDFEMIYFAKVDIHQKRQEFQKEIESQEVNLLDLVIKSMYVYISIEDNFVCQIKQPMAILAQVIESLANFNEQYFGITNTKQIQIKRYEMKYVLGVAHTKLKYEEAASTLEKLVIQDIYDQSIPIKIRTAHNLANYYLNNRDTHNKSLQLYLKYQPLVLLYRDQLLLPMVYDFHLKLLGCHMLFTFDQKIFESSLKELQQIKPEVNNLEKKIQVAASSSSRWVLLTTGIAIQLYKNKTFHYAKRCAMLEFQMSSACKFIVGACLYHENKIEESITVLLQYHKYHTNSPSISGMQSYYPLSCFMLGKSFKNFNRNQIAVNYFRAAIKFYNSFEQFDKNNLAVQARLGDVYLELGQFDKALQYLLMSTFENSGEYPTKDNQMTQRLIAVGKCCYKLKKYQKSIIFFNKCLNDCHISQTQKNDMMIRMIKSNILIKNTRKVNKLISMISVDNKREFDLIKAVISKFTKGRSPMMQYCIQNIEQLLSRHTLQKKQNGRRLKLLLSSIQFEKIPNCIVSKIRKIQFIKRYNYQLKTLKIHHQTQKVLMNQKLH